MDAPKIVRMAFSEKITSAIQPTLYERFAPPLELDHPEKVLSTRGPLTWHALTRADQGIVHRLIERIEIVEQAPKRTPLTEISEILDNCAGQIGSNTLGLFDDDGHLRAFGILETPSGDATVIRVFIHGGVDPELRQEGIGSALVAWQVGRAKQMLLEKDKNVHARIVVFIDSAALEQQKLFEDRGFSPIRFYKRQRRDLSRPLPQYRSDHTIEIVPWSEALDDRVRLAHNEAFQDHWGSQPRSTQSWAQGREQFAPQWSFVALDRTRATLGETVIAGYLMSSKRDANWNAAGYSSGFTDLLGVVRAYRDRKVATGLLVAAMRGYREHGVQYAELDVDTENPSGAHVFYESLGYEAHGVEQMLTIEFPVEAGPSSQN